MREILSEDIGRAHAATHWEVIAGGGKVEEAHRKPVAVSYGNERSGLIRYYEYGTVRVSVRVFYI